MFLVHIFFNEEPLFKRTLNHLPNVGDTVRFAGEKYGKVTEVCWVFDEEVFAGDQRINMGVEEIDINEPVVQLPKEAAFVQKIDTKIPSTYVFKLDHLRLRLSNEN